jgi:pimeloyl-ACP methyl ester carboxylesterase
MSAPPIILVPGAWLGAWAWDEVAGTLRSSGLDVTAITLPGLDPADTDRSAIGLEDHVDAICEAVTAAGRPVVLAVHSLSGGAGYAASDRIPERIAAMVYVDTAPATGPVMPDLEGAEFPMRTRRQLEEEENLDGLSKAQLEKFERRAVPEPASILRDAADLTNDARRYIPSTIVCTGFPSDQVRAAAEEGYAWLGGIAELRNVTWVDLPTSHWPMWSKPTELAGVIADVAAAHAS